MPCGVWETGRNRLGENNSFYGKQHTDETKRKISDKNKEQHKGKTYEEIHGIEKAKELRELRRQTRQGKTYEEIYGVEKAKELREKGRQMRLGRKCSKITRIKMSKSHEGEKNGFYGKHHTEEAKQRMSQKRLGRKQSKRSNEKRSKTLKGTRRGANNPAWRDGKSFEPYGETWTLELREQIRKRDNYVCQMPSCEMVQDKRPHDVHHIDYNKKNDNLLNLLTLCVSCHAKTGIKRKMWTYLFQVLQEIRLCHDKELDMI